MTGVEVQKRNVAMVYQQFINFPNFTVYDNIASPLRVKKLSNHLISQKVSKVADLLKLTPSFSASPWNYQEDSSKGLLARALVKEAELVLLDEPPCKSRLQIKRRITRRTSSTFFRNWINGCLRNHRADGKHFFLEGIQQL